MDAPDIENQGKASRELDSLGNELSEEQVEFFKDSKVRDKKGNLMVLYHGTTANFNTFKKGDVGFHFGTRGAARGRGGFSKNVVLKEVYLNITNPIVFDEDLGSWDADYRLTRELYDRGILTQAEAESVLLSDDKTYKRTTEAANKKLASVLLEKGYDGIAYSNTLETKNPTASYIVFNSNQAKEITNKTPTSNPDIRYSFRDSGSGMANDALSPYNEELTKFIGQNGGFIVDSFEKLIEVVNLAFDNPNVKATAYFGIINTDTLEKIKNSIPNLPQASKDILFKKGKDYSIATTLDAIRRIVDEKNLTREDVIDYLDRLADTILEFDSVAFNYYDRGNNKLSGLLFKKRFDDGTLVSFDIVSHKKRSVVLQTLYMDSADYQKKKAAETLLMQNAYSNTSKTQVGQPSNNSIAQSPNSVKRKFSDKDSIYLDAVNRGDMETAQRMVDEAAKEAGFDYHLYHGTNADFTEFNLKKYGGQNGKGEGYGIYLAANREISAPYGKNVIDSYTKFTRLAEGNKKTLSYAEVKKIIKKSCEIDARKAVEDGEYDSFDEAVLDTWVSNVVYTYSYSSISRVYEDVAKILWEQNDNDGELINEIMALSGAHYDYRNALNFYETILTPTTGIDGFHYIWGNKDGSGVQNDIYLAFNSEQIKSADPVTYDDEGNVIPLSERFNTKNSDIRYSRELDFIDFINEQAGEESDPNLTKTHNVAKVRGALERMNVAGEAALLAEIKNYIHKAYIKMKRDALYHMVSSISLIESKNRLNI